LVICGGYYDWFISYFSANLEEVKSNRGNKELFMKLSKKLKKLTEEYNYLKTKIDQLEELREQDRSDNTWQVIRTLKKQRSNQQSKSSHINKIKSQPLLALIIAYLVVLERRKSVPTNSTPIQKMITGM